MLIRLTNHWNFHHINHKFDSTNSGSWETHHLNYFLLCTRNKNLINLWYTYIRFVVYYHIYSSVFHHTTIRTKYQLIVNFSLFKQYSSQAQKGYILSTTFTANSTVHSLADIDKTVSLYNHIHTCETHNMFIM